MGYWETTAPWRRERGVVRQPPLRRNAHHSRAVGDRRRDRPLLPVDGPEPATVLGLRLLGRVPRADRWPEVIGGPAFLSRPVPSLRRPSRRRDSDTKKG